MYILILRFNPIKRSTKDRDLRSATLVLIIRSPKHFYFNEKTREMRGISHFYELETQEKSKRIGTFSLIEMHLEFSLVFYFS